MTTETSPKITYADVPHVTLDVGDEQTKFYVHREQLCKASSFFKAAFEGNFKEGEEQTISLPEDIPGAVDAFVHWLYTKQYKLSLRPSRSEPVSNSISEESAQLLAFADKYNIPELRLEICHQLFRQAHAGEAVGETWCMPSFSFVAHVYGNTCPGASIRRFLCDWYAHSGSSFEKPHIQQWLVQNPEVAADLVAKLAGMRPQMTTGIFYKKIFHDYFKEEGSS